MRCVRHGLTRIVTITSAICVGLTVADAAGGQQPQDPATTAGEVPAFQTEIIVTAERRPETRDRIPAATSVLTREQIEEQPSATLPELVGILPGVHVSFEQGLGGVPMISARGFFGAGEAEYVQLLIDGIPQADVESGLADWGSVHAAEIERIEALRGPGSSLYGDAAIGGVVQIFTRRSMNRSGRASLAGASAGTVLADAAYDWPVRSFVFGIGANGSRTGGYRENAAANQGFLRTSADARAGPSQWRIEASGLFRHRQEPGPLTAGELAANRFGSDLMFRFDREETDKATGGLMYRHSGASSYYQIRGNAITRHTDLLRTLLIAPLIGDRTSRGISTLAVTASGEAGRTVAFVGATELQISSGFEVSRERLETDYSPVSNDGTIGNVTASTAARRWRAGGFASIGWAVNRRVRLSSGVRWDHIDDWFAEMRAGPVHRAWSPRAGLSVLAGPLDGTPISLFVQAAHAFKAPTLDQLFDPHPFSDFSGGTFRISNPTLEAQRASNLEVGASQRLGRLQWEISAYRMPVRNEIDFDPATFTYGNIGRSRHSGVELAGRLFDHARVSPAFSYTWTQVSPLTGPTRGLQLKNIPVHLARPAVTVLLPREMRVHLRYTYTGNRYLDDEHEFALRSGSVADMRVEKRIARSRFTLDLLNVGNADVDELGFALSDAGGTREAYYFPGAGFAVRAALAVEF